MVWESTDLVNWGEGRLVEVAPPEAGNTWAPESVWDPEQEAYLVHWSSKVYGGLEHEGESHNRILYATTRDFREFSEPRVWIDRGWHTIDTTVIEHEGVYYRYLKDERSRTHGVPKGKSIFSETATSLTGEWKPLAEGIGLGPISQGEGPLAYKSNTEEKWFLWIDEFAPDRRYVPFETTDLAGGQWTPSKDFRLPRRPVPRRRPAGDRRGVRTPQRRLGLKRIVCGGRLVADRLARRRVAAAGLIEGR